MPFLNGKFVRVNEDDNTAAMMERMQFFETQRGIFLSTQELLALGAKVRSLEWVIESLGATAPANRVLLQEIVNRIKDSLNYKANITKSTTTDAQGNVVAVTYEMEPK